MTNLKQDNTPLIVPHAQGRLAQIQSILVKILKGIDNICQRHKLDYWLEAGSLLGAIRHQGFIPWDDDLDIGMMNDDFQKLVSIAPAEFAAENIFFHYAPTQNLHIFHSEFAAPQENPWEDVHWWPPDGKVYIKVDVLPFHYKREDITTEELIEGRYRLLALKSKINYTSNYDEFQKLVDCYQAETEKLTSSTPTSTLFLGAESSLDLYTLKYNEHFPLKKTIFEGLLFPMPYDYSSILISRYGTDYRTPKRLCNFLPLTDLDDDELAKLKKYSELDDSDYKDLWLDYCDLSVLDPQGRKFWESYYRVNREPIIPTTFAKFAQDFMELNSSKSILDLGCGNGRDTVYFAQNGLKATGIDQIEEEMNYLNTFYANENLKFLTADFNALEIDDQFDYIYSRFSWHTLNLNQEASLITWLTKHLKHGGKLFLEDRSLKDRRLQVSRRLSADENFLNYYRRYLDKDKLLTSLEEAGLTIEYQTESTGLASHRGEDPVIIRIIGVKNHA